MTADNTASDGARAWWRDLQRHLDGKPNPRADPGALARLRHCTGPAEAMAEPATLDLFRRLGRRDPLDLPRVAVIALVLAYVRTDAGPGQKAIQAVGSFPDSTLSRLRFRRLLACRDDDDLAREMRRFVVLADRTVNVGDLADSLLRWSDRTRANWAFHYYGAGFAAPAAAPATEDLPS